MNIEKMKKQFWEDGYLYVPDFFDKSLMDVLDDIIVEYFGSKPDYWHNNEFLTKAATEVVPWFPQNEDFIDSNDWINPDITFSMSKKVFDKVDEIKPLAELTDAILNKGWDNLYSMVMFSKKGTTGQAWHQDCPPEISAKHNLNRLIYTRDIKDEIGGQLVFVPGSHRMGEIPSGEPHGDIVGQQILKPKKGDLLLLHGHTFHRVMPIKKEYRFSINYRAMPKGTDAEITDICVYRNMRYQFSTNQVISERCVS